MGFGGPSGGKVVALQRLEGIGGSCGLWRCKWQVGCLGDAGGSKREQWDSGRVAAGGRLDDAGGSFTQLTCGCYTHSNSHFMQFEGLLGRIWLSQNFTHLTQVL